jgi:hypothetical protein
MNARCSYRNEGHWPHSSLTLSLWAEQNTFWHAIQYCYLADAVGGIDLSR